MADAPTDATAQVETPAPEPADPRAADKAAEAARLEAERAALVEKSKMTFFGRRRVIEVRDSTPADAGHSAASATSVIRFEDGSEIVVPDSSLRAEPFPYIHQ